MKLNILKSWKTTLVGVIAILISVLPVFQVWLQDLTKLTPTAILGLLVGIIGALSKDANKTGV